jgi:hypothetical protein
MHTKRPHPSMRVALIVTLGALMTAAWIFVLGAGAMWLIEAIF